MTSRQGATGERKGARSGSITTRLIVVLTLCSALVVGAGMAVDYRLSRQQILQRLEQQAREASRAAVIDIDNWLHGVESTTVLLARILEQRDYTEDGLRQMLQEVVDNSDDIFGAAIALAPDRAARPGGFAPYYYRRDGEVRYADLADEGYDYPAQPWYADTAAAGKARWVEPYYDRGGGNVVMTTFAVPVFRGGDSGRPYLYGVVTADISLAELHSYLQRLRLGNSGFGILFSRRGIVLSSENPAAVMQHYSSAVAGAVDIDAWEEMFQAALQGRVVSRRINCPDSPGRCVLRLGALDSTGWPVGVVYSEDEITAPLRDFQLKTGVISLLTLLAMAVAVALVTRRLTRPLEALAGASDAIARGDLDVPLPEARGNDEVARLVRSFDAMKTDLKAYIAELETATASRGRLEGELGAARDIQMAMLPGGGEACEAESGYALWARVRPARTVGGDLYSYHRRGRLLSVAVGDVSDKGAPAALFMARAIGLIQQLAVTGTDPAVALAKLNSALAEGNDNCMFVTLFLGQLDLDSLELHFASAGHTPPSLVSGSTVRSLAQEGGPALGLARDLAFPRNSVQLHPGDRLAVFTDGVDEAFNERDQMLGIEAFNDALETTRQQPVARAGNSLFEAIDEFTGASAQSDDICLLLLDIPPAAAPGDVTRFERSFSRGEGLSSRVRDWLAGTLAKVPTEPRGELLLVAEEIVSNVDKYGRLAVDDVIDVSVSADPGGIALEVRDRGIPFDPLEQARQAALGTATEAAEIGGLGVHLITRLTDEQSYRRAGGRNILRVFKRVAEP